tara:strand:+ start:23345 stop:24337 length:993 start_codon:yes stop_codon:yes gene_type:complete
MELLQSKIVRLPIIYLIEDAKELATIPLGIPFIKGSRRDYKHYVRLLEFEILLKSALATGLPFNWEKILLAKGYKNLYRAKAQSHNFIYKNDNSKFDFEDYELDDVNPSTPKEFVADISYVVDLDCLKDLKVIPTWFSETIEEAVKANILSSITWNPSLYNKKLDNTSGAVTLASPDRNLIVIDISGSIPKSIAKACLLLSKTMVTQFFADLIITGARSGLFDYTEVDALDLDQVYTDYGQNNEAKDFRKIVSQHRNYDNVIVFGDNHTPLDSWNKDVVLSKKQGYDICNFKVNKIISFHTTHPGKLAGYADMFDCSNVEHIQDWVKELK